LTLNKRLANASKRPSLSKNMPLGLALKELSRKLSLP
jgi:hypothetical protein